MNSAAKFDPKGWRFCREEETASNGADYGILKQAWQGTPVHLFGRVRGVSEQSYYRWKKTYGGMEPPEARELKSLPEERAQFLSR